MIVFDITQISLIRFQRIEKLPSNACVNVSVMSIVTFFEIYCCLLMV